MYCRLGTRAGVPSGTSGAKAAGPSGARPVIIEGRPRAAWGGLIVKGLLVNTLPVQRKQRDVR